MEGAFQFQTIHFNIWFVLFWNNEILLARWNLNLKYHTITFMRRTSRSGGQILIIQLTNSSYLSIHLTILYHLILSQFFPLKDFSSSEFQQENIDYNNYMKLVRIYRLYSLLQEQTIKNIQQKHITLYFSLGREKPKFLWIDKYKNTTDCAYNLPSFKQLLTNILARTE